MNILQINSVCGIGSTGRIATDIHAILEEKGHKSTIAYGREIAKNCQSTLKIGNKFNNYLHVAKTRVFDKHGFGSENATYKFIEEVKLLNPDVIHLHNIHGYYINIEILFKYLKETQKPVIWTLHDCWSFTGHCAYFDFAGCYKWMKGCYDCPEKREYPRSLVFDRSKKNYLDKRAIFRGIDNLTIVTPSEWLANIVRESYLECYDVKVINNGVDTSVFQPVKSNIREKLDLANDFLILGVASVWDRRKGLKFFLELSKVLKRDEKIIVVGISDEQMKDLPTNIIGISRTNNVQELVEIYSSCDIFVNPTLEDNFPTTNIEALACGLPVLTFNTGGSPEIIDQNTGIVSKGKNAKSLYDEICSYREGIPFDKNACIERANSLYNKNINFRAYEELYKLVIAKSNKCFS